MKKFPFVSLNQSLTLLRLSVAIIFLSHAIVRFLNGTIPRFGEYLNSKGLMIGTPLVWMISVFEIVGGVLLAIGYYTRSLAFGFCLMLIIGIVLIHAGAGWFVGEHGTGGVEYSFILIVALLVIAASAKK